MTLSNNKTHFSYYYTSSIHTSAMNELVTHPLAPPTLLLAPFADMEIEAMPRSGNITNLHS
jgi:hypothetical protein